MARIVGGVATSHIPSIGKAIARPIVIAPILGMVLSFTHTGLPALATTSLNAIGASATGAALFLTGLLLSSQPIRWSVNVALGAALKNIVQPLLVAVLVMILAAPAEIGNEAIVLMAVPSGIFGILFGLRYGVVSPLAGSTLIASLLLGIGTMAAAIFLTGSS